MPRALLLLPLLLAGQLAAAPQQPSPTTPAPAAASPASVFVIADTANDTLTIVDNVAHNVLAEHSNVTVAELLEANNETLADLEGEHDPIVRKKRTFGDIVFRGLADVLGYQVQRKPAQEAFPPPLAPVPGIDIPLQAAPAPAPAPAVAAPPCGTPRAVGPPPCRVKRPPPPPPPPKPAPPPCAKPRAAPKPRPPPPPPPPPPCGKGRANPATPAPCNPAPPKLQGDPNLESVSSNFRLDFNFNRAPATPATQATQEFQAEEQPLEQPLEEEQFSPIAIQPRAAKLPLVEPRKPRVYVDAFVVRNGVARRVDTVDAQHLGGNGQQGVADVDYLAYDDDVAQSQDDTVQTQGDTVQPHDGVVQTNDNDDYDDLQQYQDRSKVIQNFGTAVNNFWEQKQMKKKKMKKKKKKVTAPASDYRDVHFGNRDLADEIRRRNGESHQSLQRENPKPNRIPLPLPEAEEDSELTTTTEDPRRRLKPRVLPPTEKNPGQIDTVTVRVPPIYKETHPKKLHKDYEHESIDMDDYMEKRSEGIRYRYPNGNERHEQQNNYEQHEQQHGHHEQYEQPERHGHYDDDDSDTEASSYIEAPKSKRHRKQSRRTRSVDDSDPFSAGDYDYYGKKLPISKEEELYRGLTIPPPTLDPDLARLEKSPEGSGHFLDDSEKIRDDREKIRKDERSNDEEDTDESERTDSAERSRDDRERTKSSERVDEKELTDELSPNAKIQETGYQNKFVEATSKQVDANQTRVKAIKRRRTKKVPKT